MRAEPGQLERVLTSVIVGSQEQRLHRKRTLADSHTGPHQQPVHVPLAGIAGATWGFADTQVVWEWPFLYAPAQWLVPFKTPHFSGQSIEITSSSGDFVDIKAQVLGWLLTDQGWYLGARVRFAVIAPLVSAPVPYSAIAHLTFTGYSTYAEGEEFSP